MPAATQRSGSASRRRRVTVELRPSRSRPDTGVVTVRSETRDQLGEVVQVLVAKLVVPRRTPPEMRGSPSSKES